jgi:hypothetical protein
MINMELKNSGTQEATDAKQRPGKQRKFRMDEGPGTAMRVDRGTPYSSDLARGDFIQIQLHSIESRSLFSNSFLSS